MVCGKYDWTAKEVDFNNIVMPYWPYLTQKGSEWFCKRLKIAVVSKKLDLNFKLEGLWTYAVSEFIVPPR